jgi:hypothetical protein
LREKALNTIGGNPPEVVIWNEYGLFAQAFGKF